MAFTTQFCARIARSGAVLALLLVACSPAPRDFGFSLDGIESHTTAGTLEVVVHQKLVLSREARNALDHGVPLAIQTELALRHVGSRDDIRQIHRNFEIHYLPLSDRYQLTTIQPFRVSTFPRLRHVLAELATVKFTGKLELRVRSFLDKQRMPPPMRLPMLFSSQWQHDSGWRTWPLARTSASGT